MDNHGNDFSIIKNKYYIIGFIHIVILVGICITVTLLDVRNKNENTISSNNPFLVAESSDAEEGEQPITEQLDISANSLFDSSIVIDAKGYDTVSSNELNVSFDSSDWKLILVNKTHQIPDDYEVPIGRIKTSKGSMKCDERVVQYMEAMIEAAKEENINLVITSPMRSETHQNYLFNRKIKQYMKNGMSYMEAYSLAAQAVTIPGTSEHQIGLAFDITSSTYSLLNEGFGETDAGIWLKTHCMEYGFILRYPEEKEMITGIEYEPWHFRYVGIDAAQYITDNGLCLEEFIDEIM